MESQAKAIFNKIIWGRETNCVAAYTHVSGVSAADDNGQYNEQYNLRQQGNDRYSDWQNVFDEVPCYLNLQVAVGHVECAVILQRQAVLSYHFFIVNIAW